VKRGVPAALIGLIGFRLDLELLLLDVILSSGEAGARDPTTPCGSQNARGTYASVGIKATPASRIGSARCRKVLRTDFAAAQDDITGGDTLASDIFVLYSMPSTLPSRPNGAFQPSMAVCHLSF
jgi:hypothetical protein